MKLKPHLTPYKNLLKCIIDLNVRAKTIRRKHRKETSVALRLLAIRLNTQLTKNKKQKVVLHRNKLLCFKGYQQDDEKAEWEEILASHITDKEFIYRIYVKNSYKSAIDNS